MDWFSVWRNQPFSSILDLLDLYNFCIWYLHPSILPVYLGVSFFDINKSLLFIPKKKHFNKIWIQYAATGLLCHFVCIWRLEAHVPGGGGAHTMFGLVVFLALSIIVVSSGQLFSWWISLSFIDFTFLVGQCIKYVVGSDVRPPYRDYNEICLIATVRSSWCLKWSHPN